MKILHVGKFWPMSGGMERVMYEITMDASARGHQCDMLCAAAEKPGVVKLNERSRIICTPTWCKVASTMITPGMVTELRKICDDYDIVHVHHPDPMATLALRLSGYKGKVIVHWHSDILKQKTLLKFYKPLQNWMLKRADAVIGTSPVYIDKSPYLVDFKDKTTCLPIGVAKVTPSEKGVEAIRNRYKGKKIIFSVGRLVGYKGHKYLIDAAKYLADDYVVVIGGSGPMFTPMKLQIAEQGLENKVVLPGRLSHQELQDHYGACDVFCLSSIWKTEAFGLVQVEAMSCGKPVVATLIEGSGVSWVNLDGYSGLNVPTEDGQALAEAIMAITKDEETYKQFSENARKRYENCFTREVMLQNCREIYSSVLKGL